MTHPLIVLSVAARDTIETPGYNDRALADARCAAYELAARDGFLLIGEPTVADREDGTVPVDGTEVDLAELGLVERTYTFQTEAD